MDQTNKILDKLKVENKKAAEKEEEVNKIKADCEAEKAKIEIEKKEAEDDLATAMPFLNAAIAAGNSIDVNAVKALRQVQKPVDACKIVMDAILIVLFQNLDPIKINSKKQLKNVWDFIADSYDTYGKDVLKDEGFVKRVQLFTDVDKDKITDE